MSKMPEEFLWGGATAVNQYEGGFDLDGRRIVNADVFPTGVDRRAVMSGRMKMLACDSDHYYPSHEAIDMYYHYKEDIRLFTEMRFKCHRFSTVWSRILPIGDEEQSDEKGLDFYEKLIDTCLKYNIEPLVTICHFDVPMHLVTEHGSRGNRRLADFYLSFCRALLTRLKGKVKYWLTLNEINMLFHLPFVGAGLVLESGENETQVKYQMACHELPVSALATRMTHEMMSGCMVGRMLAAGSSYPYGCAPEDVWAVMGWERDNYFFIDVQSRGKYPSFTRECMEKVGVGLVMGPGDLSVLKENTVDFTSFSHHASRLISANPEPSKQTAGDVMAPMRNPYPKMSEWGWQIDPLGLCIITNSLYDRYQKPLFIVGNGLGTVDTLDENGVIHDDYRIDYLRVHIQAMKDVVNEDGVELLGYTVWGCIDLVSASTGEMKERYGFIYADKDNEGKGTLRHSKKDFFDWYKKVIETNGESL